MKEQYNFTDIEYAQRRKKTKRDEFLEMMDKMVPWGEWA
jgi:IS5 family transposase